VAFGTGTNNLTRITNFVETSRAMGEIVADKVLIVAVPAVGIILLKSSRCAVLFDRSVNTVPQFFMGEHGFAGRLLNIMATAAVHRFCTVVRDLFDIGVAVFAADACVGTLAEESFVHIKQAIGAFPVHAGKTSKAVAYQAVLSVRSSIFHCPGKAA
jgi:hypothetical protein